MFWIRVLFGALLFSEFAAKFIPFAPLDLPAIWQNTPKNMEECAKVLRAQLGVNGPYKGSELQKYFEKHIQTRWRTVEILLRNEKGDDLTDKRERLDTILTLVMDLRLRYLSDRVGAYLEILFGRIRRFVYKNGSQCVLLQFDWYKNHIIEIKHGGHQGLQHVLKMIESVESEIAQKRTQLCDDAHIDEMINNFEWNSRRFHTRNAYKPEPNRDLFILCNPDRKMGIRLLYIQLIGVENTQEIFSYNTTGLYLYMSSTSSHLDASTLHFKLMLSLNRELTVEEELRVVVIIDLLCKLELSQRLEEFLKLVFANIQIGDFRTLDTITGICVPLRNDWYVDEIREIFSGNHELDKKYIESQILRVQSKISKQCVGSASASLTSSNKMVPKGIKTKTSPLKTRSPGMNKFPGFGKNTPIAAVAMTDTIVTEVERVGNDKKTAKLLHEKLEQHEVAKIRMMEAEKKELQRREAERREAERREAERREAKRREAKRREKEKPNGNYNFVNEKISNEKL